MKNHFRIRRFDNGLRYVLAPIGGVNSVTVLVLVKAGTRHEKAETNGLAHFLEHAVSKGTRDYPSAIKLSLAIDRVGGEHNAFTGKELTGYYVKAAAEQLELALKVTSQLVFHPLLPENEIEVERGVILEEIRMYEDDPQAKVLREFEGVVFADSNLGWKILGTVQSVNKITREHLVDFHHYLYVPERMVVVVAGGISENPKSEIRNSKLIGRYFEEERQKVKLAEVSFNFKQKEPKARYDPKKTEQCHLVYGYRAMGRGHKDRYVLAVLTTVLGGGMSSRLYTEIREKRGLAYYIGAFNQDYQESGYLAVAAGTGHDKADEVVRLIEEEFSKLTTREVSKSELDKAKAFLKGHVILGWEDSFNVASFYGEDLLLEEKIVSREELIEKIEKVSALEVKTLSKRLFVPEGRNLAMMGRNKGIKGIKE